MLVAGCTSTVDGAVVHVGDAAAQTRQAFQIALDGLARAGATVEHVVRTRMYVVGRADADAVGGCTASSSPTSGRPPRWCMVAGL